MPKHNIAGRWQSFQEAGIVKPGLPVWLPTKETTATQLTQVGPALAPLCPPRNPCVPWTPCAPLPGPWGRERDGWKGVRIGQGKGHFLCLLNLATYPPGAWSSISNGKRSSLDSPSNPLWDFLLSWGRLKWEEVGPCASPSLPSLSPPDCSSLIPSDGSFTPWQQPGLCHLRGHLISPVCLTLPWLGTAIHLPEEKGPNAPCHWHSPHGVTGGAPSPWAWLLILELNFSLHA